MNNTRFNRYIRIVTFLTVCAFMSNTVLYAIPVQKMSPNTDTLQVQSQMFAPIIPSPGWERVAQVKAERNAIIFFVVRDKKRASRDINAAIDKWCGAKKRERVLTLLDDVQINSRGETVIEIGFLEPKEGDVPFRLTIKASDLGELMSDPANMVRMSRLNVSEEMRKQKESATKVVSKSVTFSDFIEKIIQLKESSYLETEAGKDELGGLVYDIVTGGQISPDIESERELFSKTVFFPQDKEMQKKSIHLFEQDRVDIKGIRDFLKKKYEIFQNIEPYKLKGKESSIIKRAVYVVEAILIKELFGYFVENDKMMEIYKPTSESEGDKWMSIKSVLHDTLVAVGTNERTYVTVQPIIDRINDMAEDDVLAKVEKDILHPWNEKYINTFGFKNEELDNTFEAFVDRHIPSKGDYCIRQLLSTQITLLGTVTPDRPKNLKRNLEYFENGFTSIRAIDIVSERKRQDKEGTFTHISFIQKTTKLKEEGSLDSETGRNEVGELVYDIITGGRLSEDNLKEREVFAKAVFADGDKDMQKISLRLFEEEMVNVKNMKDFLINKRFLLQNAQDRNFNYEEREIIDKAVYAVEMILIKALLDIFSESDKMIDIYEEKEEVSKGSWKEIKATIHEGLLSVAMNEELYNIVASSVNADNKMADDEVIGKGEEMILHPLNKTYIESWGMEIEDLDTTFEEFVNRRTPPPKENYIINQTLSTCLSVLGMMDIDNIDFMQNNPEYFEKAFLLVKIIGIVSSREEETGYRFLQEVKKFKVQEGFIGSDGEDALYILAHEIITSKRGPEEEKGIVREIMSGEDTGSSLKESIKEFFDGYTVDAGSIRKFLDSKEAILGEVNLKEYGEEEKALVSKIIYKIERVLVYELFGLSNENSTLKDIMLYQTDDEYWQKTKQDLHSKFLEIARDRRLYSVMSPIVEKLKDMTYYEKVKMIEEEIIKTNNEMYERQFGLSKEELALTFEDFLKKKMSTKSDYCMRKLVVDGINGLFLLSPEFFDIIDEGIIKEFEKIMLILMTLEERGQSKNEKDGNVERNEVADDGGERRTGEKKITATHRIAQDIFKGREGAIEMFSGEDFLALGTPVDIVLDIRVVLGTNAFEVEENAKTLAALILAYSGMNNVNFVFTEGLTKSRDGRKEDHLSSLEAVNMVRDMVREKGGRYQFGAEDIVLVNARITDTLSATGENGEMPIEIVITSDSELNEA
ncbi:MAG: hypothetical protein P9L90_04655, partial [Candidatus Aadella gelida]|nr:hypothetical protein [Candidatus Aadella gelida]